MTKTIAITQRVVENTTYPERRDALAHDWYPFLNALGVSILPLPNDLPAVKNILAVIAVDGLILSGGNDLETYDGDAPERDQVENFLLGYSIDNDMPVIGVCRGMQIMHVHQGGQLKAVSGHAATRHSVYNDAGKRDVNSYHTWGIEKSADTFEIIARAEDGTIEEIAHKRYKWHSIMWHPEREAKPDPEDVRLFKEFFDL